MSGEHVPSHDAVLALERELSSAGTVVLGPARARIVAGQVPGLVSLGVALWLVPQAIDKDGVLLWLVMAC